MINPFQKKMWKKIMDPQENNKTKVYKHKKQN